jgi:hypothetical protein
VVAGRAHDDEPEVLEQASQRLGEELAPMSDHDANAVLSLNPIHAPIWSRRNWAALGECSSRRG